MSNERHTAYATKVYVSRLRDNSPVYMHASNRIKNKILDKPDLILHVYT